MKSLIDNFSLVRSLNTQTGDLLEKVALVLQSKTEMKDAQLNEWVSLCKSIASSGWHGWDAAREYIQLSKSLYSLKGSEFLLQRGQFGLALSKYSFEPALNYYSGLSRLMLADRLQWLSEVEEGVLQVQPRYHQVSTLLVDAIRSGFALAEKNKAEQIAEQAVDKGDLRAWRMLLQKYVDSRRPDLEAFLKSIQGNPDLPWQLLEEMGCSSLKGVSELIVQYPRLASELDSEKLDIFSSLFLKFTDDGEAFRLWLDTLAVVSIDMSQADCSNLARLMAQVPDADLARRLLKQSHQLPLNREDVLAGWIEDGLRICDKNRKAGEAWFDLESVSGKLNLQLLEGRVVFPDFQRLFHLFTEAMTGSRLVIEKLESADEEDYRELPFTDGKSIYLPEKISAFDNREENFFLYKMTLLHQLGFYEFGTFSPNRRILPGSYSVYFSGFSQPNLAEAIFNIAEDARIDWLLFEKYKGIRSPMSRLTKKILDRRALVPSTEPLDWLLEALIRFSLTLQDNEALAEYREYKEYEEYGQHREHGEPNEIDRDLRNAASSLIECFQCLKQKPTLQNTLETTHSCYEILEPYFSETNFSETNFSETNFSETNVAETVFPNSSHDEDIKDSVDKEKIYQAVSYRGTLDMDALSLSVQMLQIEESINEMIDGEETLSLSSMIDPENIKIDELKKGDVQESMGMFLTELEQMIADEDLDLDKIEEGKGGLNELLQAAAKKRKRGDRFYYDEWDCLIDDYRSQWCTLYELREMEEQPSFVRETLKAHPGVATQVRKQLQMLKPEMLRKVKAMPEGEDLDMEKVIEAVVDRKSGRSPDDNFYIQRTRKERDVSALFLLDMSASTDDIITPANSLEDMEELSGDGGVDDSEDILDTYYAAMEVSKEAGKRIIDIEKEAAVLMAEALEDLGDLYSICGFSGYGREKVDYYVFKDFDEKYSPGVKGKIGGIKPCRSTRMGPAIRHAVRSLVATESRIKSLIILSDGYPQDYDYGHDRNDRDYGLQDTTKALSEARQKGVQSFCLTVDPSGHDYLRKMCPDNQYMVIQDIEQLPHELSKVYRSLTG